MKMTKKILLALMLVLCALAVEAQEHGDRQGRRSASTAANGKKDDIVPEVRAWRLSDGFTRVDTIPVDTLLNQHQINNPIWKKGLMSVTLGNLGSPSMSVFYPQKQSHEGNIFFNSLMDYVPTSENVYFYNTRTPYTRLAYQMGTPKRRSEEMVDLIYTQNVNRRVNLGFEYYLLSSIGKYDRQMAEHAKSRFWASVDGDYYRAYGNFQYNRASLYENGGLLNDNFIMYPDSFSYNKAEDYPITLTNAWNTRSVYSLIYSHNLDLGHVERMLEDSTTTEVAPMQVQHVFEFLRAKDGFHIGDLRLYEDNGPGFFANICYTNPNSTYDNRKYTEVKNHFALIMPEEFNKIMHFGVKFFAGVDIRNYRHEAVSTVDTVVTDAGDVELKLVEHRKKETRAVSYLGGELFKNQGDRLTLDAKARFYFAGYKVGDLLLEGNVSLRMKGTTNAYAKAKFELTHPSYYEDNYESNHFVWHQRLDMKKRLYLEAGLNMPSRRFNVYVFAASLNKWIYFNRNNHPDQNSGITQIVGLYAQKHFDVIGFNAMLRFGAQATTDAEVMPLPAVVAQGTFFYEHLFFDVLQLQLGCDVRYNTRYRAPIYNPAVMQFASVEDARKVGNYPYLDPFVNFHLKRVRFYLKYEHVNSLFGSKDYFHAQGYPANNATFKYGISWNFYD